MYVPIIILVVFSFDNSRLAVEWHGFTLSWYQKLFQNEAVKSALFNSLLVASIAVTVSVFMGVSGGSRLEPSSLQGHWLSFAA
jgi:spermidine/putrescine transport system permease protein